MKKSDIIKIFVKVLRKAGHKDIKVPSELWQTNVKVSK